MLLKHVRIRNFRTISEDITLNIDHKRALVGPNNSGKTNILKAIYIFFCHHGSTLTNKPLKYSYAKDFPRFLTSGRTTINAFIECEATDLDNEILVIYDDIKRILGLRSSNGRVISVLLTFSEMGTGTYQAFPTTKRPTSVEELNELNQATDRLFHSIFSNFAVHYIQSDKRFEEIYSDLLLPSVKAEISTTFADLYDSVRRSIETVNQEINQYMRLIDLDSFTIKLSAPDNVSDFIKDIEFRLQDEIESALDTKGTGIQALAVTASMLWLQKYYKRNQRSAVFLIEEPESFLHPSLIKAQSKIIDKLSENSTVLYATHAIGFVPSGINHISGVQKDGQKTVQIEYKSSFAATETLRRNLGVKFSDFFNLGQSTIAVEGPSDKMYLDWFLKKYHEKIASSDHSWPLVRSASIIDYGGVKPLQFFIQATYEYISKESVYVILFDGDRAGVEARSALQSYFKNKKMEFQSNIDFVSCRSNFAIEGLFDDQVIKNVYALNSSIFDSYSEDSAGTIEPFKIKGTGKMDAFKLFTLEADRIEAMKGVGKFISLCNSLEKALEAQKKRIK